MSDSSYGTTAVHVLMVCTANVARSPLAAALLRNRVRVPDIAVSSAGTHARPGQPAAEGSLKLAAERGLDLSEHRSNLLAADAIERAHLVLVMTEDHRDTCGALVPGAGARTFTLREFVRLLGEVDTYSGPVASADRLLWLRQQAHYARPRSLRPTKPEDIPDPIGAGDAVWRQLGTELDALLDRVTRAIA